MDRAHRLGQTRQVTVYRLITKGTIDERIVQLARVKKDVSRSTLNAVSSLTTGNRYKTSSSATRRSPTSRSPAKSYNCCSQTINSPILKRPSRPRRARARSVLMLFKRTQAETSGTRRGTISSPRVMQDWLVTRLMMTNLVPQFQLLDVAESAVVVPVRPAVVDPARGAVDEAKRRCLWPMVIHNG